VKPPVEVKMKKSRHVSIIYPMSFATPPTYPHGSVGDSGRSETSFYLQSVPKTAMPARFYSGWESLELALAFSIDFNIY
jgi:hypothetical protein